MALQTCRAHASHPDVVLRVFFGGKEEKFYPIHEAAQQGDFLMLLLCLRQGVDPFQRTSLGRTPLELALAANVDSSHNEVIFALTEPPETLSVHGFLRTKGCWSDS